MKQTKPVYDFDDLLELLSEHAIGTEVMQNIEQFCQRRKDHTDYLVRRLRKAESDDERATGCFAASGAR